ncbi:hypothetical protein DACRYDRAFT_25540 [Dacryopinax primogenitus]|uniref:Uncharacterized protein n=1 Tax=Dacryopinax primogenitus (strain DJM 731) TaxID=1858805 RepID=M5FQ46_DACPD|nr:uncharacterized protein DACRYDRAFT_25540 [Dacryopinax primogenitus]EJT96719.1 hypothetical protein DACRYDRAFT_25540 [Dacryopinax primogenitus]
MPTSFLSLLWGKSPEILAGWLAPLTESVRAVRQSRYWTTPSRRLSLNAAADDPYIWLRGACVESGCL